MIAPKKEPALQKNKLLDPRLTFEAFVPGGRSHAACRLAKSIAAAPGAGHNPYVIWGGIGLGKSHLLHAIGNAMQRENPRARVLVTSGEQFVKECEQAARTKRVGAFRARYREIDCLLFKDIQFLIAQKAPEGELIHIVDELLGARKQIVFTSDRAPEDLAPLDRRLVALLKSGAASEIMSPDLKTRLAIVRTKCALERFPLSPAVTRFVAESITRNVRSIEGALIRLKAFQSMTQKRISAADASSILKYAISADRAV
ncbi:MAG: ATP-binding protein [Elusimicrobia bacterium]|nr:ATP-binding protein [Elusimicrobiota bacterium]MDE2425385.1 ATP-binding protein [Elusimicrobiota bacterium]